MFISTLRHRRNNKLIILGVIRIRLIERGENMLILGSNGFSYTQIRQKIGERIPDRSGNMLILRKKTYLFLMKLSRKNI